MLDAVKEEVVDVDELPTLPKASVETFLYSHCKADEVFTVPEKVELNVLQLVWFTGRVAKLGNGFTTIVCNVDAKLTQPFTVQVAL